MRPVKKDLLTTSVTFARVVGSPYYWLLTGLPMAQRRQLAYRLRKGKPVSIEKQEEILSLAGCEVKQEKIWRLPG